MTAIPILMYHNIGRPPAGARLRSLYVRHGAFARQMRLLRMLGYQGLSMQQAMPYLRGERTGRVAVITFDDGYQDTLDSALPVLKQNGFSATCYVVSGRMGSYNDWDAQSLGVRKPLMSVAQVRTWHAEGMEVGAHTRSHPHLPACSDDDLKEEVAGCKSELEDLLGAAVTQFCYPYGDQDPRCVEAVRQAGFIAATTTRRGRALAGDDPWLLRRVLVGGHNLLHLFGMKLMTAYEDKRG